MSVVRGDTNFTSNTLVLSVLFVLPPYLGLDYSVELTLSTSGQNQIQLMFNS